MKGAMIILPNAFLIMGNSIIRTISKKKKVNIQVKWSYWEFFWRIIEQKIGICLKNNYPVLLEGNNILCKIVNVLVNHMKGRHVLSHCFENDELSFIPRINFRTSFPNEDYSKKNEAAEPAKNNWKHFGLVEHNIKISWTLLPFFSPAQLVNLISGENTRSHTN